MSIGTGSRNHFKNQIINLHFFQVTSSCIVCRSPMCIGHLVTMCHHCVEGKNCVSCLGPLVVPRPPMPLPVQRRRQPRRPPQFPQPRPPQFRQPRPPQFRQPRPPQFQEPRPPQFRQPHPPQFREPRPPQFRQPRPPQIRQQVEIEENVHEMQVEEEAMNAMRMEEEEAAMLEMEEETVLPPILMQPEALPPIQMQQQALPLIQGLQQQFLQQLLPALHPESLVQNLTHQVMQQLQQSPLLQQSPQSSLQLRQSPLLQQFPQMRQSPLPQPTQPSQQLRQSPLLQPPQSSRQLRQSPLLQPPQPSPQLRQSPLLQPPQASPQLQPSRPVPGINTPSPVQSRNSSIDSSDAEELASLSSLSNMGCVPFSPSPSNSLQSSPDMFLPSPQPAPRRISSISASPVIRATASRPLFLRVASPSQARAASRRLQMDTPTPVSIPSHRFYAEHQLFQPFNPAAMQQPSVIVPVRQQTGRPAGGFSSVRSAAAPPFRPAAPPLRAAAPPLRPAAPSLRPAAPSLPAAAPPLPVAGEPPSIDPKMYDLRDGAGCSSWK